VREATTSCRFAVLIHTVIVSRAGPERAR
jgi:hypothetical protein